MLSTSGAIWGVQNKTAQPFFNHHFMFKMKNMKHLV